VTARALVLRPRLLFLGADPALVRAQLESRVVPLAARPLRDDVSTDEIVPLPAMVQFDAALGGHAHTGFAAGGQRPIGRDAVRESGIEVVVAGSATARAVRASTASWPSAPRACGW
jgi:3-isopropylmalate/(R)-2-methylmalate dehydratase large subunit